MDEPRFDNEPLGSGPYVVERVAGDEMKHARGRLESASVVRRNHLRAVHSIHKAAVRSFENDGIAGMNLPENPKMGVPMPGNHAVFRAARHRGSRKMAGAAAEVSRLRTLDDIQLGV